MLIFIFVRYLHVSIEKVAVAAIDNSDRTCFAQVNSVKALEL